MRRSLHFDEAAGGAAEALGGPSAADPEELISRVRADRVEFVNLQFTDVLGAIKGVTIPAAGLGEALARGVWFDGSSVEGFARIHESDMVLRPDPGTYRVLPWGAPERRQARLICDVQTPDQRPFPGDPRGVLRRAMARAEAQGHTYNAGPELEFFLFKRNADARDGRAPLRPVPHDVGGYFDFSPQDLASTVRADIMRALAELGITAETAHHEVATAQHEIDFRYCDGLTAADNVMTVRQAVKAVAAEHDLYATFMPKPICGANGSGMHTHQSFFDRGGRNAFFDAAGRYELSDLARHYIAGQLAHAPALSAVLAPTVNSYKRLVPGYEAPVYICWARTNRSALIRVPCTSPGREQSARAELRCPDPSANPYLAFAVMLAAGLDGIERRLAPPEPVEEDVYHFDARRLEEMGIASLPGTLAEALDALEKDEVVRSALGDLAYQAFARAKRAEWDEYRIQVSDWELERYLETL
ncbi:MAG: type I glutamate--ammonia ligase [Candidatus Eisenbacteria bacterium]|uniref:Glutamine synthetase n=1 Tax=Eiseniibacteriota bacterium TaxID=2212470 RepID=A0A937XBV1_UNCEI|nr:type I glutamate--ammonia ligase [Candidatus Eisenbacteria bacterium]